MSIPPTNALSYVASRFPLCYPRIVTRECVCAKCNNSWDTFVANLLDGLILIPVAFIPLMQFEILQFNYHWISSIIFQDQISIGILSVGGLIVSSKLVKSSVLIFSSIIVAYSIYGGGLGILFEEFNHFYLFISGYFAFITAGEIFSDC